MATPLFEIWENPEDNSFEMSDVSRHHDELRKRVSPRAILRHTFRASSDFEAPQIFNDWMGHGTWKPEPDWVERHFTNEEAHEQELFLLERHLKDRP